MRLITKRAPKGFTLIELMVVVAIIGILAAIVVPSYQSQVRKSRRTDAKASLMQAAQQLERCFTENNTYDESMCTDYISGVMSNEGFYTITAANQDTSAYTLRAMAIGAQVQDTQCFYFYIDNIGTKTSTDNTESINTTTKCW